MNTKYIRKYYDNIFGCYLVQNTIFKQVTKCIISFNSKRKYIKADKDGKVYLKEFLDKDLLRKCKFYKIMRT